MESVLIGRILVFGQDAGKNSSNPGLGNFNLATVLLSSYQSGKESK